jgi:hypothetical protein
MSVLAERIATGEGRGVSDEIKAHLPPLKEFTQEECARLAASLGEKAQWRAIAVVVSELPGITPEQIADSFRERLPTKLVTDVVIDDRSWNTL